SSLPHAASTMTTQVRLVTALDGRPKRASRSTTGTTAPRRLITPRTHGGIIGTSVTPWYSMISLMPRMPMANCSCASMKVRYCAGSISAAREMLAFIAGSSSKAREVRFIDVRFARDRRRRAHRCAGAGTHGHSLAARGRLARAGDRGLRRADVRAAAGRARELEERHRLLQLLGLRAHLLG